MISIFVWVILVAMLALMAAAYINNKQQARRQSRKDHMDERRERFFRELSGHDNKDDADKKEN